MRSVRPFSILASIRIRYLLLVTMALGLIFFALAWQGIRQARSSLLKIMVDQGIALMESLTLSSNNAIQANLLLEKLSEERFVDIAEFALQELESDASPENLRKFIRDNDLNSLDLVDTSLQVIASDRWVAGAEPFYPPEILAEIRDMALMGGGYRSVMMQGDDRRPLFQFFIYSTDDDNEFLVLSAPADYLGQINSQIGIGHLIQEISRQSGIEYIILQSRQGIILSSRALQPIPAIESDPFLDSLMETDSIGWREYDFEGRTVLEFARRFESVTYPPGMYRLGLDLKEYDEIKAQYSGQIITIAIILFLLTLLVVAVVSINQNYFILDRNFRRMQSVTTTIFDQLTSAILAYNHNGKIIGTNRTFQKLMGFNSDPTGKDMAVLSDKLPFELPKKFDLDKQVISLEKHLLDPEGRRRTMLIGISALPDEAGGGAVVLMHDITDLRQLEEKNRRQERLSEMGDMAAGVAHEIRNPLNAIGIAAQRLRGEFSPEAESEEYQSLTNNILNETKRLNDILSRFLELTRIKAQQEQNFKLSGVINRAIESLTGEAHSRNVKVKQSGNADIDLAGDSDKLLQVFINLIKNSIQAMPDGGEIAINTTRTEGRVSISITDTGPGFGEDVLPKIFQPYFTTKADGSGLGLALAYKTITEMGGDIIAENSDKGGARVRITLS